MSDSSSIYSDISVSWLDDIHKCIVEFEEIIKTIDSALTQLYNIRRKIVGPMITYEGETKSVSMWLMEWEDEMNCDKYNTITWGQFILEKLEITEDA